MSTSSKPVPNLRTYLHEQLVADQPGLALAALQAHAPKADESELATLLAQYETVKLAHTHPDTDPQDFRQRLNQLNLSIAQFACDLPVEAKVPIDWQPEIVSLQWEKATEEAQPIAEEPTPKETPPPRLGISDRKFQWHILILLLLIKAGIFLYMSILREAGAFSSEQYQATLSLLIPVVAAYLGTMFKHLFGKKDPNETASGPEAYTSRQVQWLTYGVFAIYALLYFLALTAEGKNAVEFKGFVFQVNTIEAIFGVLIGYVVSTLFKEPSK